MHEEETSLTHYEWIQIFEKLKTESTYKFLYTDVDAYEKKLNKMLSQDYRYHKNLMKKSQHNILLDNLKTNFLKISNDLHLLDLTQLALCIDNTFDTLLNCLRSAFLGFTNSICVMREEQTNQQSKFFSLERCQQCQSHIEKIKIESLKTSITLCEGKPSQSQMNRLNSQLDDLGLSYEDIELSLMIDEVLQGKDNVLNAKNNQITAIYEEIAQYLQNIPKQTLVMGRQEESFTERNKFLNINSISKQIQNGLSEMLKDPIRKFIARVFYFFKNKNKQKQFKSTQTQTLILTDQETIKSLNKSYQRLKRQFEAMREAKRQSQRDYIKMIEQKQINQIKIKEMETVKQFLENKCDRIEKDLRKVRKSLEDCENSKRQLSENLIKEYTAEKSSFLRNIHQLSLTLEASKNQVYRLRKITQGSMISRQVQVSFSGVQFQTQTKEDSLAGFEEMHFLAPTNSQFSKNNSSLIGTRRNKIKKSTNVLQNSSLKCSQTQIAQPSELEQLSCHSVLIQKSMSSKTSIHQQIFEQTVQHVEGVANDRVLNKITVKIDESELERNDSVKISQQYTLREQSVDISDNMGSLPQSKQFSKQGMKQIGSNRRRETANSGQFRAINFLVEGKKRLSKACSSRMFMPVQHCSPYIGPKHQGQMNWLQIIQETKARKNCEYLRKELSNEDNNEKIQFISKLFFNFNQMKNEGLIDQISSLISKYPHIFKTKFNQTLNKKSSCLKIEIPNFDKNSNHQHNKKKQSKVLQMRPSCSQIPLTPSKSKKQDFNTSHSKKEQNHKKKKNQANIIQLNNLSTNNNTPLQIKIFSNSPIFIKKHTLLLFDSEDYMKKYERYEDIWGLLESSMMVDSSFGTHCDNACNFILRLQKTNIRLYQQCINLLKFPFKYLKKLEKKQITTNEMVSFKKKIEENLHKRHLSGMLNKENNEDKFINVSPSELRHTLIKLFRFHKVIHRKCSHVQQFLTIIGFKPSLI